PQVNVITGFTATGDGGQVPNTSERAVSTVVRMRNGETLAIGGLIRDEDVENIQRVPGLSNLPVVGELFKFRNRRRSSSEVLIFITPTVIPDTP
ncbi:MAG: type II secretion system protein GspD, partial [Armatimonadota bacterium]|nr:type II secretion system protein GspD [Armatimonadota bacterium]